MVYYWEDIAKSFATADFGLYESIFAFKEVRKTEFLDVGEVLEAFLFEEFFELGR